ncbi:retinol dehydrogenase 13-like [Dysidea avara]|uniref:retinol dehydrogenase 13-like n=1 Tax=Dysidea avara TaxID=196820 RepID=UPI00331A8516
MWPLILTTVGVVLVLWMIRRWVAGAVCQSKAKLDGKMVIITGANTGIGKETAIDLAKRNARVILACRSQEKGKKAEVDVRRESGNNDVHFRQLDLSSFTSIRKFAKEVLEEESCVDILINNAAVGVCPYMKTEDGFETQFGVNHLGHFLLTNLLLDKIKQAPEGRIVNVSSIAHTLCGPLDLDTINSEEKYSSFGAYNKSKLANVLFTKQLAKRLEGTNVTTNCLHPGGVDTELQRHLMILLIMKFLCGWLVLKTVKQGAQTSIHLAVSEDVKEISGEYFSDCKLTAPSKHALDEEAAENLWKRSEEWTKL